MIEREDNTRINTRFQATQLGQHARQQGVRGDVERNAQPQVAAALVHLAAQLLCGVVLIVLMYTHYMYTPYTTCTTPKTHPVGDVKLTEHVARWKSHMGKVCRVPRVHQDAPIVGLVFNLVDHLFVVDRCVF
jgi:hypothetical protein